MLKTLREKSSVSKAINSFIASEDGLYFVVSARYVVKLLTVASTMFQPSIMTLDVIHELIFIGWVNQNSDCMFRLIKTIPGVKINDIWTYRLLTIHKCEYINH